MLHNEATKETYFGSGKLESRRRVHESFLKNNTHYNYKLQKAYNANGPFEFIGVPVEKGDTLEEKRRLAFVFEQSLIDVFKGSPLCLNIATHVEHCFVERKHTDESNEKNRQKALERWQDPEYRKKQTLAAKKGWEDMLPERREQIGKQFSETLKSAYADGRRISNLGQTRSDAFCEHNSSAITEKWKDPEYRSKQCASRKGKPSPTPKKPVYIDGVQYDSITSAAEANGITKQGALYRASVDSPRFENWSFEAPK